MPKKIELPKMKGRIKMQTKYNLKQINPVNKYLHPKKTPG